MSVLYEWTAKGFNVATIQRSACGRPSRFGMYAQGLDERTYKDIPNELLINTLKTTFFTQNAFYRGITMSKSNRSRYKKTTTEIADPSFFSKYTSITVNHYWIPNAYLDAVTLVIQLYKSGVPFNKAVDQAYAAHPPNKQKIGRNKLAEHTLKYIANDY